MHISLMNGILCLVSALNCFSLAALLVKVVSLWSGKETMIDCPGKSYGL